MTDPHPDLHTSPPDPPLPFDPPLPEVPDDEEAALPETPEGSEDDDEPAGLYAVSIDDGVPMPPPSPRTGVSVGYPWARLQVGQSFFIPRRMKNPRSATAKAEEKTGFRFEWRRTQEKVAGTVTSGVRMWRTK
jgi:hypothetical protein